ncbi:MAG: ferritin-like domain-containing protein [Alphaproteobacteria bacterium]|nr:ferritin-like domain-containing protein [Alphaproteobacteria bacterium]
MSDLTATNLAAAAAQILATADPAEKVRLSALTAEAWRSGGLAQSGLCSLPDRPARPAQPVLSPANEVPRRRINTAVRGRIALLHALAHIELNAIDLAWDIIARFASPALPKAFFDDWVLVAAEEAKHFSLLAQRLREFDAAYGDLPAHDGLWESAMATRHDLAARLAVVPLVLEARGLDVTPAMIAKLQSAGDDPSAAILEIIYRDEIGHVRIGQRWFSFACAARGLAPEPAWRDYVATYFKGALKPPFNVAARDAAGIPQSWYALAS